MAKHINLKSLEKSNLQIKRETVSPALYELINRHKQLEVITLFGKLKPDSGYVYKKGRF